MRNSRIICVGGKVDSGLLKTLEAMNDPVVSEQVFADAVNKASSLPSNAYSIFQCSGQTRNRNTHYSSSCNNTLNKYRAEYFLN